MLKPWPTLRSSPVADCRVFQIRKVLRRSPRTGVEHDFFILDSPDWVNVVALTPDGHVVMVEQFRHGTGTIDLEIPGGVMDETDASPVATGIRELREETGYEGGEARIIGSVRPNPAIQSNTCHTVLITHCTLRHDTRPDQGEDLTTRLVPATEMPRLVSSGTIRHSLVVAALYDFELWQRGITRSTRDDGTGQVIA